MQRSIRGSLTPLCGTCLALLFSARPCAAQVAPWEVERRLTRSATPSETSFNFARNVAADECGFVHLAWFETVGGKAWIQTRRSADGGRSWGPAARISTGSGNARYPSVAAAGGLVHVVWWDDTSGRAAIRYRRSRDGGATWDPEQQIVSSPANAAWPSVAVAGGVVHVVYVDERDGSAEVYHVRSLDGGTSWQPETRLSPTPHNSYTPTVAVSGASVYVAWTDTRFGLPMSNEEEYFRRSRDGGATWDPEVRLTNDPANSWAPSLAADGDDVWIAWFDDRSSNFDIYLKHSRDRGATWSPDRRLTADPNVQARPSIAFDGQLLHVLYFDTRHGNEEIYALASGDRGETFGPEQRLTDSAGSSTLVTVAASAYGTFAAWQENRDGNNEIYFRRVQGLPVATENGLVAFTRMAGGMPQIFSAAPDGSGARQLTGQGPNQMPAWSRDGSRIAFTSQRTGTPEIWVMDADGSNQRPLTQSAPGGSFVPDWSYDGTRIAFARVDPMAGHPEIWVMNADGSDAMRLTITQGAGAVHPSFAPDDTRIVYASGQSGSPQIWMMFSDGQGNQQKTNGFGPGYPHASVPEWSRAGDRIVFWSGIEGQVGEVWTMDWTGANPARVTETQDPRNSDNPAWAPDTTRILFDSNRSGTSVDLYSVAPNGSGLALQAAGAFGQSAWQPVFRPGHPAYGNGCTGTNGVPELSAWGCAQGGFPLTVRLARGLPGAPALVIAGFRPDAQPLPGGCTLLVALPIVPFGLRVDAAGGASVDLRLPPDVVPGPIFWQAFVLDPGPPQGFCASQGVHMEVR